MSHRHGREAMVSLGIALLGAVVLHYSTYRSMVEIWATSDTFLHCFLIFPISGYLVWRRWSELRQINVRPFYPGIVGIIGASIAWWLADFLGIQVGKQLMAVSMIPLTVLTVAGPAFTRAIAFPLGYLVFAVPFGIGVIPYLIDFTAFFTVNALQITGFPVLRDGSFFSIPAGNFEVAKACSGIRYLLASLAIGTLYGYLIFTSLRKRIAFFFFALLLPIFANGVRAYGIVLLAHFSDMKLAVGVDHLVYGWMFFGVVMLFMFWVGNRFEDRPLSGAEPGRGPEPGMQGGVQSGASSVPAAALTLLIIACAPALAFAVSRMESDIGPAALPSGSDPWSAATSSEATWQPDYKGATYSLFGAYLHEGRVRRVDVAIFRYDSQRQGSELANSTNSVVGGGGWQVRGATVRETALGTSRNMRLKETLVSRRDARRLIWSWHEVNGEPVVGNLETKLAELQSVVSFDVPVSAAVVISIAIEDGTESAREILDSFLATHWQTIHDCLYAGTAGPTGCRRTGEIGRDPQGDRQKQMGER